MGRPREFDENAVLDAAVLSFWARGYEATSLRDLAASTGLTCASLYNAFGDKRALFQRALDYYVARGFSARVHRLEELPDGYAAIVTFFEDIIARSLDDPERKGCFLVNSALEVAPHDIEFRRAIEAMLCDKEAFFRRCVEAGQAAGTIGRSVDADDMARLLLSTLLGLRVLARSRPEPELLRGALRPVLTLLEPDRPA